MGNISGRPDCRHDLYCYRMDDDHWSKYNHPKRSSKNKIRLFHGTTSDNARSIHANGWIPSVSGRLGPGVYFATQDTASAIAKHRGNGNNSAIIEAEINVGRIKTLTGCENRNGDWGSNEYHICKAKHPQWCKVQEFPEWCIRDLSRIEIQSIRDLSGRAIIPSDEQRALLLDLLSLLFRLLYHLLLFYFHLFCFLCRILFLIFRFLRSV